MTVAEVLREMRSLPMVGLDDIFGTGRSIILAPHPDDESLGCGGMIAEACGQGRDPFVLFVTDGTGSHPSSVTYPPERLRATREAEAVAALCELGLVRTNIGFMRLMDTQAPQEGVAFDAAVTFIAATMQQWECTCIVASWRYDPHCDHVAAHLMAAAVAACLGVRHVIYPVWGWTLPPSEQLDEMVRGGRLNISHHLPAKRRAIAAHASQHGGLITDDPTGFHLPADLLTIFDQPYEVFLTP